MPHCANNLKPELAIIHGVVIELLKWLFAWDGKKSNLARNLAKFDGGGLYNTQCIGLRITFF